MDHLFDFGEVSAIQVPVYGTKSFDDGPFASFPDRQGLNKENLLEVGDFQGWTSVDIASFFQSWLYFGLLAEFFKAEGFNSSDFITTTEDGTKIVTSTKLPHYLAIWESKVRKRCIGDPEFQNTLVKSLDRLFAEVYLVGKSFVGDARAWPHDCAPLSGVPEPLALSIIVLFEALSKATKQVTGHSFNYDWQTSKLLIEKMERDGWCHCDVNFLARMKIDTLYSASTMMRPNAQRSHLKCTPHGCKAEQVEDGASYAANCRKHVAGCQWCPEVEVDAGEISAIIGADATPLIYYDNVNNRIEFESVTSNLGPSSKPYIALSHVWADGLGNPIQNSLYSCQLARVQDLMNKLSENTPGAGRVLWWCDTLCVPVDSKYKRAKKKAIRNMRQTYERATKVIVLDGDLANRSCHCTIVEVYLRIITSAWMKRLWTFQEGFVARNLYFQFQEGAVALVTFQSAISEMALSAPEFLYWWYDNDFTEYLGIFTIDYSKHPHLISTSIFRNVQWRSTSHEADETVCLATIHGLDVGPLLDITESERELRMAWFLENLEKLPASILFQKEPHLGITRFRWAPSSLMQSFQGSGMSWLYDEKPKVQVLKGGQGARALLPGIYLEKKTELQLNFGMGFAFRLLLDSETYFFVSEFSENASPSASMAARVFKSPAIILYEAPSADGNFKQCDTGILVDVKHCKDSEELIVDYVTLVGLARAPGDMARTIALHVPDYKLLGGRLLSEDQGWLLV